MDYCGDDYDDHDIQEEMWDDGYDSRSCYVQDVPTPPEPRRQFKMPWQAVLSVKVLLGGKVQAHTRPWPKIIIDSLGWDHTTDRMTPCPHCKFYFSREELAEEITHHRRSFIADNQRRAERRLAEQTAPAQRPRLQRSRKGKAATQAQLKPESKPGGDDLPKTKPRRPRKTKTRKTLSEETETSTPTTKQSDLQDPADSHGSSKNKNDPSPRPLQSGTMESAPEDTATSTTTTAETSSHPSSLVSISSPTPGSECSE